jgi:hypothetical protein
MNTPNDPFPEFEQLVNGLVHVQGDPRAPISRKVDLLERLIERWRIERHKLSNELEFEEFLVWRWFSDGGQLHFTKTNEFVDYSAGTAPLRLQRKLLVFLLLNHGKYEHVLDIIRNFVRTIRADLNVRDFKKTETGVFRCFTNTRFAANTLRDYGLLKYTRQEAFKVWILSLPGLLVAARALSDGAERGWKLPTITDPWHRLDPFTLRCAPATHDLPALVRTLSELCAPNTKIFTTFNHVLEQAHGLLKSYWATLADPDLPTKAREDRARHLTEQLEIIIGYPDFIDELTSSIQIDNLLAKVEGASESS